MNADNDALRTSGESSAKPEWVFIGGRLKHIRGPLDQLAAAQLIGVHKNTYARWERGEREISADALMALLRKGWNTNWILTGEGPERLDTAQAAPDSQSHPLQPEDLTVAIQLAQEVLDGDTLEPPDYAQLVMLIYDALVHGLPSAQVLAFARPAARGLSNRGSKDGKSVVGGPGQKAAG